jgi:urea transport system substrate-binding protein
VDNGPAREGPDTLSGGGPPTGHPAAYLAATDPRFPFLSPPTAQDEIGWLGSYRIRGLLGEGGMGFVFDAEDTHLQRRVALKVMRPEIAANPSARQRFVQEARAAAALPHDRIVTIYSVGHAGDVPFLAMQYLEGESLEDRLRRQYRLAVPDAVRIGREMAEGLAAAHRRGLIHRDIKPANVWLEGVPADHGGPHCFRVKLLDFGLARQVSAPSHLTASGHIVGTPQYLAPEQARGSASLDGRCDLFALGVVLYRALSGVLPFDGDDVLAVLGAIGNCRPRPLGRLQPELPPRVCALVHRLLSKDPAARPPDAPAVVAELAAIERRLGIAGSPCPAEPTTGAPAGTGWHPPRGRARWALIASLLALVVVNAVVIWVRVARRDSAGEVQGPGTPAPVPVSGEPIKLGLLFPLTGYLKDLGSATNEAALLAVEEVNQQGGVLGRRVQAEVRNGSTDLAYFAEQAERLITHENACAIVGCWTSASRKTVRPVVERHNSLLLYPVQSEGLEESPNIFYLGAAPNQEIVPAIEYLAGQRQKRKFFLVGADTVYCHVVNAIIRDTLKGYAGTAVVGEVYFPMGGGESKVEQAVHDIKAAAPDLIVNTIGGATDLLLTKALRRARVTPRQSPMLSFVMPEEELRGPDAWRMAGDFVACNYFQSIPGPANEEFVRRFRSRYGPQRFVTDPMENAYVGVHMWARAVRQAGTTDPAAVRGALEGLSFDAPDGPTKIDARTHYVWNIIRVAQVAADGRIKILQRTDEPERPVPFPPTRTRAQWEKLLDDLYRGWGNHWEAPQQ